ncbi:MAG: helix-turn-helix domain-containing protein [Defluviitaleaceae bacterium]|nr:helix-turn-helix domain-containing protein [Defluviitaleaceae bacterium]
MNLAAVLVEQRRARKITQEELAAHVGVSKASVSKWENGISYPDIVHLPVIAAFFDITVDQLINYSAQLPDAEMAKIYNSLAESFATEDFEAVIVKCERVVKKHYSCYPMVLFVVQLYINHAAMAPTARRKNEILNAATSHCQHVLQNCHDANLLRGVAQLQALCYSLSGEAEKTIQLLCDETQHPTQYGDGMLVSQAHQMLGNLEKAAEVEQAELYQCLMHMMESFISYLRLNQASPEAAKPAYLRAHAIAEMFNLPRLNANTAAILYYTGAQMYCSANETEKAITALQKYTEICTTGLFPFTIRGDDFFNKIDSWLTHSTQNIPLPRNEAVVKASMLEDVTQNPAFDNIKNNEGYMRLIKKLEDFVG